MVEARHGGMDPGLSAEEQASGDRPKVTHESAEPATIPPVLVELAYYLRAIRYGRGGAAERSGTARVAIADPPM